MKGTWNDLIDWEDRQNAFEARRWQYMAGTMTPSHVPVRVSRDGDCLPLYAGVQRNDGCTVPLPSCGPALPAPFIQACPSSSSNLSLFVPQVEVAMKLSSATLFLSFLSAISAVDAKVYNYKKRQDVRLFLPLPSLRHYSNRFLLFGSPTVLQCNSFNGS